MCVYCGLHRNLVRRKMKDVNQTPQTLNFLQRLVECQSIFLFSSIFIIESYNIILFKVFPKLDLNDFKRDNTRIF